MLIGNVGITTPCLHELMRREIPVTFMSHGGWFLGHTIGAGHKNVELRTAQYQRSFEPAFCLRFARELVAAKIQERAHAAAPQFQRRRRALGRARRAPSPRRARAACA